MHKSLVYELKLIAGVSSCTDILAFYTVANVHSITKQILRIIHTSLAHRKSFHEKPSERYHPAKVFMLGRTGTNELQMGR